MGHWAIIACLFVSLVGVLLFLAVVADELRLLDRSLHLRKRFEAERRMRQRAQQEAAH